jgi:hypothetical protein
MSVKVVEGKGHLTTGGKTVVIPAGSEVNIPMDEDLNASGEPSDPEPYDASELGDLPVDYLPDEIEVAPPADEETIQEAEVEAEEIQQAMDEADSETTDIQAGDDSSDTEITDNSDSPGDIQPTDVGQDQPPDDGGADSSGE